MSVAVFIHVHLVECSDNQHWKCVLPAVQDEISSSKRFRAPDSAVIAPNFVSAKRKKIRMRITDSLCTKSHQEQHYLPEPRWFQSTSGETSLNELQFGGIFYLVDLVVRHKGAWRQVQPGCRRPWLGDKPAVIWGFKELAEESHLWWKRGQRTRESRCKTIKPVDKTLNKNHLRSKHLATNAFHRIRYNDF